RQILYWLGKNYTGLSLPQIGHRVGRRDHTSALWGIRKVQAIARLAGQTISFLQGFAQACRPVATPLDLKSLNVVLPGRGALV
ncbi:helix-turn-helix domain-containing protein, partial [Methylobacterium sp. WL7]|uniref:helix-turn-helix domain-containing protein n=1 Tax=Methylobacterium sp. WL7 TaxID=2603900 RepID=UPI0011D56AB0